MARSGDLVTRPRTLVPLLVWSLAAALAAGCGDGSSRQEGPLTFRVDPARLGERFEHPGTGLALRAPAGWDALPDSLVRAAMARLRESGAAIGSREPEMLAVYRGAPEGATLAVSRYDAELPPASRDSLALLHLATLRRQHPGAQVDDGRFVYRGFEIVQLRAVDSVTVAFKLLLSRKARPLVQLDYVVPRSIYSRELESVESSIGSLEPRS